MTNPDRKIHDNGGSRSGNERRQDSTNDQSPGRRSGRDRRRGFDRRSNLGEKRKIERRDSWREKE